MNDQTAQNQNPYPNFGQSQSQDDAQTLTPVQHDDQVKNDFQISSDNNQVKNENNDFSSTYVDDYEPPKKFDFLNMNFDKKSDDINSVQTDSFKTQNTQEPKMNDFSSTDDSAMISDDHTTPVFVDEEYKPSNNIISGDEVKFKDDFNQGDNINPKNDDFRTDNDTTSGSGGNSDLTNEGLETQNIFNLLGVEEGNEDLKEKFLDQLQEVVWDDFLQNDVELLLTEKELEIYQQHKSKLDSATTDEQKNSAKDEIVEYLEGLVPDLEDIVLEKALDLKSDLYLDRINDMKKQYADNPSQLELVKKAEQLMQEDKWKSSSEVLNSISE